MTAAPETIAFVRFHIDKHPLGEIAVDLKLPVHEVELLIEREKRRRQRNGTLPKLFDVVFTHQALQDEPRVCADHGPYIAQLIKLEPQCPAARDYWTNCPQCDRLWQADADKRADDIRSGMNEKQRLAMVRIAAANIPERFKGATIWNYQHGMERQAAAWEWARDYCQAFDIALQTGRCGLFTGATGTGKTHLAIGVLKHILEKGGTGYYTTAIKMLSRIKSTFGAHSEESEAAARRVYTSCDLLVLDEVGRTLDTTWEQTVFFDILNERYAELKPVLIVSNLPVPELRTFLTEPVVDRMKEAGGALRVFDWASYRSHKRKEE
jgi:DNA replication protein DnaC